MTAPCYLDHVIQKLVVSNYRSLGEGVEIPLGQMSALVGINAAGKSTVLDVLRFTSECLRDGLAPALMKRNGLGALRRRSEDKNLPVTIRVEIGLHLQTVSWEFSLRDDERGDFYVSHEQGNSVVDWPAAREFYLKEVRRELALLDLERRDWYEKMLAELEGGKVPKDMDRFLEDSHFRIEDGRTIDGAHAYGAPESASKIALALQGAGTAHANPWLGETRAPRLGPVYTQIADTLRNLACYAIFPDQLRPPQKPDAVRRPMDEHGANWTSALRRLKKEEAGQELLAALGRITGDITDYRVTPVGGYLVAEFRHGQRQWLDASQESDGTLRIAGLLTALLQDPPLSLVGIEEPELTVHPGALPVLFDFLREAGKRSQILLSTHSPDLLDLLDVDDILIVSRGETTTVAPIANEQRESVRRHLFSTSDLLRAEGLRSEIDGPQGG